MEGLEFPFPSSTPGVLASPSFPLPFWCPVKGCAGDVAWLSSHRISDPSGSPSQYDGAYAVLVAAGEMLVGVGLGPGYSQDSMVLGVEGGQFTLSIEVAFSYPPAF